jgi:hypothetical protein
MKKILFSLISIFILSLFIVNASGLGVAPATLNFEDVLVNTVSEKEISIQNPGDESISVSIEIEGELKEWISLDSNIEIPAKSDIKVKIRLNPSLIGEYNSKLKFRVIGGGEGVGLFPGVDTNVVASVIDKEIIFGEVSKILTKDEEYGDLVVFDIGFVNKGNVPVNPLVKIDIVHGSDNLVDSVEMSLGMINPGVDSDYKIEWDSTNGDPNVYYRANVKVLLDGKVIEEKEGIGFRVLESTKRSSPSLIIGVFIIAIILIIGLIIFYLIIKKVG